MADLPSTVSGPDLLRLADRVAACQIKALSIKQPWPNRIFHDGKDVENRDWPTKGRGWFIVHAGVSKSECCEAEAALPRGGVVGMARITDCVTEMDSDWFRGRYGFVLRDAFPLPLVACKGALGFFRLPPETCAAVANEIRARAAQAGGPRDG
ncbi:hypothetical protein GCM10007301_15040 [Azorhizobium oxalatiphilum]|uniref:ASCH domain-containing protein n=1 Tax=Azorhizobium oxalatiphilum TaxID=980631 RepID=A0A917BTR8_9HYPH|nr:hypothetical protein [Azorhizobium oxalatiphilum]GGF56394.1 hypothetical protein GCM10007301_15040 [Azorhizobium oxalatiphilum]